MVTGDAFPLEGATLNGRQLLPHSASTHTTMEYSFCPKCGGTLELVVVKPFEPPRMVCIRCQFVFFQDPKVAACCIVHIDQKIILLRRAIHPGYGKWVFPGGYVDRGETVTAAAIREAREEVNLEVQLVSLLGVYSYPQSPVIIIVYVAEMKGGTLLASDETLEVSAFAPREIPWEELAFPSTTEALKDFVRLYYPE
ncbi:MAG: NUDIX hydrolase [Terriglobia bacterium]